MAANRMEAAKRASVMVKQDPAEAGFIAHKEKSDPENPLAGF